MNNKLNLTDEELNEIFGDNPTLDDIMDNIVDYLKFQDEINEAIFN